MVGTYTLSNDSVRVRNKNGAKRKRNQKVKFRNSIEKSSYEHIDLNSSNCLFVCNESFLLESSNILNDDFIGLSKHCLKYPKT